MARKRQASAMTAAEERNEPSKEEAKAAFPNAEEGNKAASYDFRSDTVTTPTPSMLASIMAIPIHGDDVWREDETTAQLEAFIAKLTGKPAALFVMSGTMGNQVSLRTHLNSPPHSVLMDHRGHIYVYEAGGAAVLSQAQITPVIPSNGLWLTLDDITKAAVLYDDIHHAPTRLIALENSLKGVVMPLEEVRKIRKFAKAEGLKMHLDGARLWNVVAAGAGTLEEYCAEFDSISLCFSKGLGAPVGSIIVGEKAFIEKARWFRKLVGGATRQSGVLTAPARVAVEEVFLGGQLTRSHQLALRLSDCWKGLGGKVQLPVDTNMVWLDLDGKEGLLDDLDSEAKKEGLKTAGDRVVVHHQISDNAIEKLERVFQRVAEKYSLAASSDDINSSGTTLERPSKRPRSVYARGKER